MVCSSSGHTEGFLANHKRGTEVYLPIRKRVYKSGKCERVCFMMNWVISSRVAAAFSAASFSSSPLYFSAECLEIATQPSALGLSM